MNRAPSGFSSPPARQSRCFRAASAAGALALLLGVAGCVPHVGSGPGPVGPPEAHSIFGQPLYPPELPREARQRLEVLLDSARLAYERDPDDADATLSYGRRAAALGHYQQSIQLFTLGMQRHPRDPRFYRFRGHRMITVRRFDRAIVDLQRAARLTQGQPDVPEPDAGPVAGSVPLATLQGSIWYHLGVAHYLRGEFLRAAPAFRAALGLARNDDARVAAADWLYMSLRRGGRAADAAAVLAALPAQLQVTENQAYLRRLRLYRGELPADSLLEAGSRSTLELATQGYGVGNWYLYNGHPERAQEIFWQVTSAENWAPFGYIAAEADLRRLTRQAERRAAQAH